MEEKFRFVHVTPYEKNIEIWRQLWMVIEKSDILVQIVDCRDPLFFRCDDLEKYVHEVGTHKVNFLLLNKADLLEEGLRKAWSEYFNQNGIKHLFFSAKQQQHEIDKEVAVAEAAEDWDKLVNTSHMVTRTALKSILKSIVEDYRKTTSHKVDPAPSENPVAKVVDVANCHTHTSSHQHQSVTSSSSRLKIVKTNVNNDELKDLKVVDLIDAIVVKEGGQIQECNHDMDHECDHGSEEEEAQRMEEKGKDSKDVPKTVEEEKKGEDRSDKDSEEEEDEEEEKHEQNIYERLGVDRHNLISKPFYDKREEKQVVIGMIGFPNVGKSSVINVLCNKKLVGVGSRPGKTKNFQTIFLEDDLLLCDCPGLVFPDIAHSRSQMVCNSVIPIDNAKDFMAPIALICGKIPCRVLEYVLKCPMFTDTKYMEAGRLLHVFALNRGMISGSGMPNYAEAAKAILKRLVNGDILCAELPPLASSPSEDLKSQRFNRPPADYQQTTSASMHTEMEKQKYTAEDKVIEEAMDDDYFHLEADVDAILQDMTQEDVFDLVMGKKVKGLKLDKVQRRELKFAIKRDADTDEIMGLIASFLGRGGKKFISIKKAAGQI